MNSDFKVSFGRRGRELLYEDEAGALSFSWEMAMPDGKRFILYKPDLTGDLKPIPKNLSESDQQRVQLAFERVKEFVQSKGYKLYE